MTTMELNLRKQHFTQFILSMDEEEFTELEKYAKTLSLKKAASKSKPYPWALSEKELTSCVREAREDLLYGRCISDEDLTKEMEEW